MFLWYSMDPVGEVGDAWEFVLHWETLGERRELGTMLMQEMYGAITDHRAVQQISRLQE